MQLICPSCSKKHQTEKHPGAFEIACSCGYSLLIPDEIALDKEVQDAADEKAHMEIPLKMKEPTNLENNAEFSPQDPMLFEIPQDEVNVNDLNEENPLPNFSSEPAAQEAQDEAFIISGDALGSPSSPYPGQENNAMTAPEDLPPEMPYDRFEIQNFEASAKDFTSRFDPENSPRATTDKVVPPKPIPETAPTPNKPKANASEPAPHRAQVIIEKSLRSSIGQLLGFSYDLKINGLSEETLKVLRSRALEFCHFRPWLGDEVKKRNILVDQMLQGEWIANLPEGLAVELYIKTLELGGQCEFQLSA